MNLRTLGPLVASVMLLAPAASRADLAAYSQDFEGMSTADGSALSSDGWLVYANVFSSGGAYLYGYGPYPAPNGTGAFSGVASGEGGPAQGAKQMVVYSDYNNTGAHSGGQLVEANVFQQQIIGAADVGDTWKFSFEAKRGNLTAPSTAVAFIKTLDPSAGYATTGMTLIDMTSVGSDWGTFSASFQITAGAGQILQFGFANTATRFQGSGVLYDNISMAAVPEPSTYALMFAGLGLLGAAARRRAGR